MWGSQPVQRVAELDGQRYPRNTEDELGQLPACPARCVQGSCACGMASLGGTAHTLFLIWTLWQYQEIVCLLPVHPSVSSQLENSEQEHNIRFRKSEKYFYYPFFLGVTPKISLMWNKHKISLVSIIMTQRITLYLRYKIQHFPVTFVGMLTYGKKGFPGKQLST